MFCELLQQNNETKVLKIEETMYLCTYLYINYPIEKSSETTLKPYIEKILPWKNWWYENSFKRNENLKIVCFTVLGTNF